MIQCANPIRLMKKCVKRKHIYLAKLAVLLLLSSPLLLLLSLRQLLSLPPTLSLFPLVMSILSLFLSLYPPLCKKCITLTYEDTKRHSTLSTKKTKPENFFSIILSRTDEILLNLDDLFLSLLPTKPV